LQDLCQLHALGALDGEERAVMERLLAEGGEDLKRGLREAIVTNAAIAALAPQMDPPKRLRKKILAGAGADRANWNWLGAWAAATAALVAAVLWFSVEDRRKANEMIAMRDALGAARTTVARTETDLRRVQAAFHFLNQPETRLVGFGKGEPAPPRGNVFVNPNRGVLLIAANLPRLQSGSIYQMWLMPKSGKPFPAGLFQSTKEGTAVHLLASVIEMRSIGAVAVSIEPESGSAQPTTAPVIVAPLAGL
jgi:anti-sigma-K factor RskA